jgi:hypothetical protein
MSVSFERVAKLNRESESLYADSRDNRLVLRPLRIAASPLDTRRANRVAQVCPASEERSRTTQPLDA